MRAVRLTKPGFPLEMMEVGTPRPGPKDVLVRVGGAGVCHSDAHYRAGDVSTGPLPLTLGHEVAGVAEAVGGDVTRIKPGDHVCLHYMVTCGSCDYCNRGMEQFCTSGEMLGKDRDGGYAEYLCVPERSTFLLPPGIPLEHGAVMMCSSATSLHALNKSRLEPGESVAVWGTGGLGISGVQLAKACGADRVYAVDIRKNKLALASSLGAVPVDASSSDPVETIMDHTNGRGVDVVLEFIGLPQTLKQAMRSLSIGGRVVVAGLAGKTFSIDPYKELVCRETEIIGVSDHLASEIPRLIDLVLTGALDLDSAITRTIGLNAEEINGALDGLGSYGEEVRVVIRP